MEALDFLASHLLDRSMDQRWRSSDWYQFRVLAFL